MKLNNIVNTKKVKAYGFDALVEYASNSNRNDAEIIVSSLPFHIMLKMQIHLYCVPKLSKGVIYNTPEEIEKADLDLQFVSVDKSTPEEYDNWSDKKCKDIIIVINNEKSVKFLKEMFPSATVLSGNIHTRDITDKYVVGVLPTYLISYCRSYRYVITAGQDGFINITAPISVCVEDC